MTTGQVLKLILKETGFYKRKVLFFILLAIVGIIIYFLWVNFGRSRAAIQFSQMPQYTSIAEKQMEVTIEQNGTILIDGKKTSGVFHFYEKYDELRILVFDSPGEFISLFRATVHLPAT